MRVHAYADMKPIVPVASGFRSGEIVFRDLMCGVEGSASNYALQMVDVPTRYSAPRHRHNFEQVRIMLDGSFGFGPGQVQEKGSVGYFCEGTYYTQNGEGKSTTLLLQIAGPSGQGYMSRRQLRSGIEALRARGTFAEGIYTWLDASGKKHNQDSYEAVWEHVHGKPVRYPKPQYLGPVLLEPERFAWRALAGTHGVSRRHLGAFNDHALSLSQLSLQGGASLVLDARKQAQLLFCLSGSGSLGGQTFAEWASAELALGEQAELKASQDLVVFVFGLPRYEA